MSLADEYRRQFAWRGWATALSALPPLGGHLVLDLGCAQGDPGGRRSQAAVPFRVL
jgi:hypothetical protein